MLKKDVAMLKEDVAMLKKDVSQVKGNLTKATPQLRQQIKGVVNDLDNANRSLIEQILRLGKGVHSFEKRCKNHSDWLMSYPLASEREAASQTYRNREMANRRGKVSPSERRSKCRKANLSVP